ncbi:LOW QUALITY PROTEIN: Gag protein, partial [Phytophthora palmivora]
LRAAFLPANYEYRLRSRFLACKQGKRELHEYIQEMRVLAASLVGNPLPEHIKVTVFMDGLKVGPSRTQLFRVHANAMEEAVQIALQEEYGHRQARTPTSVWQGHNASSGAVQGAPAAGASTGPVPMELGTAVQSSIRCYGCGKLGHMQRACPAGGQRKLSLNLGARGARGKSRDPRARGSGVTSMGGAPYWGRSKSPWGSDGARHGGLAAESLGALEARKSNGGLLVNPNQFWGVDELCSTPDGRAEWRQVSVRLVDGTVVNVPEARLDLVVKFDGFDSTEAFLDLDMNKYDLISGMPWLEKHELWIDWRSKAIGARRPAVSDRALVSNVPTSVRDWGARDGRQGAYAPEDVLGVTDSNEDVAMSLATGSETKAHCQACEIAMTASPNVKSRRAYRTALTKQVTLVRKRLTVLVAYFHERSRRGGGNVETYRVDSQAPHSESEIPPSRPVGDQYSIFDGVTESQVVAGVVHLEAPLVMLALLNLEKLSMKDFLVELKAGEIAEMVLLKPETSPEDLNSSFVMDEDVPEGSRSGM